MVVDTKCRQHACVYQSDVIQLSVYRTILANTQGLRVASYGYVRCVGTDPRGGRTVIYLKASLLPDKAVLDLTQAPS